MNEFQPTHSKIHGNQEVQTLGDIILMSAPLDGLVGISYKDSRGKVYAMLLDEFLNEYEPLSRL